MYLSDIEPHWSVAKIDCCTYECSECGFEIKKTVAKSDWRH